MNIEKTSSYFRELLAHHEFLKEKYEEEMKKLPAGKLGMRVGEGTDGKVQYCCYLDGKRKGITGRPELVDALVRKRYLEESLSVIRENIRWLKKLTDKYRDIDRRSIIEKLPDRYAELLDKGEADWNRRKAKWLAADYEMSTYDPWEKEHVTAKGLRVRSKSEVIIAEKLDFYGIPYRYEEMLYIRQYSFAPDFTILTKAGLKYLEHAGLVNDDRYMNRHNWKMKMYALEGIVPWKNLIVTYDEEDGGFNSRIIEAEIINKLLPYC